MALLIIGFLLFSVAMGALGGIVHDYLNVEKKGA